MTCVKLACIPCDDRRGRIIDRLVKDVRPEMWTSLQPLTLLLQERLPATTCVIVKLGHERAEILSKSGCPPRVPNDLSQTTNTFCSWSLLTLQAEILHVPDCGQDARFRHHPLVTCGAIKSYLGAPVLLDGQKLGNVCVINAIPRAYSASCAIAMGHIADIITNALQFELTQGVKGHAEMICDIGHSGWPVIFQNIACSQKMNMTVDFFWNCFEIFENTELLKETHWRQISSEFTVKTVRNQKCFKFIFSQITQAENGSHIVSYLEAHPDGTGIDSLFGARLIDDQESIVESRELNQEILPLDGYHIGRILGRGRFGSIYAAADVQGNLPLAIKEVDFDAKSDEAAIACSLQHANVIRTWECRV